MKIWIDIRNFCKKNNLFVKELIENISKIDKKNNYNIYWDIEFQSEKINIINNQKFQSFFWEQTFFLKKLLNDKNDIVLFFDETRPIFYKKNAIQVISSLERLLYPDLKYTKFFKKYSFLHAIKSNIKSANKIICFDEKTKKDINEKLNTPEEKINIVNWFFWKNKNPTSKVDVKTKHQIIWDYVIYDNFVWVNKNIKRFLESIKEINKEQKLSVIFIWNEIAEDIETRQLTLDLQIEKNIIFAWNIQESELWLYYENALWVVYPAIYESFPKNLSNAVFFNTPIIAADSENIKNIFWWEISYFSPLSTDDMTQKLKIFTKERKSVNYENIKNKFNAEIFFKNLLALSTKN